MLRSVLLRIGGELVHVASERLESPIVGGLLTDGPVQWFPAWVV